MQGILIGLRKSHNETQKQLAELLNISEESYRNKETGKNQFKMDEMFAISDHYNKSLSEIFLPRTYTLREHEKEEV